MAKSMGENIKRIRKSKGLTQKEVAEKLGISQQSFAQYERVDAIPKFKTLQNIADALDVSVGDIIYDGPKDKSRYLIEFTKYLYDHGFKYEYGDESLAAFMGIGDYAEKNKKDAELFDKLTKSFISDKRKIMLTGFFDKLNELGQEEAVQRVQELTWIKKYTEPDDK
jgi:phage element (ICEBs1)transcriptional regulator (xre family) protein